MAKILGYCQLCREEEINRYGITVSMMPDNSMADIHAQHDRACYDAGCKHPPFYYDCDLSDEQYAQIDKELEKLGPDDKPQNDF